MFVQSYKDACIVFGFISGSLVHLLLPKWLYIYYKGRGGSRKIFMGWPEILGGGNLWQMYIQYVDLIKAISLNIYLKSPHI